MKIWIYLRTHHLNKIPKYLTLKFKEEALHQIINRLCQTPRFYSLAPSKWEVNARVLKKETNNRRKEIGQQISSQILRSFQSCLMPTLADWMYQSTCYCMKMLDTETWDKMSFTPKVSTKNAHSSQSWSQSSQELVKTPSMRYRE